MPTIKEIQRAIGRISAEKTAGDNVIPAEFCQALASGEEGLEQIAQMIAESWQGTNFEEWKLSKLKILPNERRSRRPQQLASRHAPRRAPEDRELSHRATAARSAEDRRHRRAVRVLRGQRYRTTDGAFPV